MQKPLPRRLHRRSCPVTRKAAPPRPVQVNGAINLNNLLAAILLMRFG